jgi:hypothetical protein
MSPVSETLPSMAILAQTQLAKSKGTSLRLLTVSSMLFDDIERSSSLPNLQECFLFVKHFFFLYSQTRLQSVDLQPPKSSHLGSYMGKTFLACTFAQKACRERLRTLYIRCPRLLYWIALARADRSYGTLIKRLSSTHLLVLDDFGLAPLTDTERRDLLEVIEGQSEDIHPHHQPAPS